MNNNRSFQVPFDDKNLVFHDVKYTCEAGCGAVQEHLTGYVQWDTPGNDDYCSVLLRTEFDITQFDFGRSGVYIKTKFVTTNLEVGKVVHEDDSSPGFCQHYKEERRTFAGTVKWQLGDEIMYLTSLFTGELDD